MGHLGHLKEEYRELVQRLASGAVGMPEPTDPRAWQGWKEILEILFTPDEADLASRMPVRPSSLAHVAEQVGLSQEDLRPRLEALCDKGLVMDLVSPRTGKVKYFLSPPVVGFFEFSLMRARDSIPKKRMAEALDAYMHHDDAFAREVFDGGTVIGRALVHEDALGDEVPDVLDWERATAVIEGARAFAVSLCYCRHKQEHLGKACDAPMENCLSINAGAEFVIRRGFGRSIDKGEALDLLHQARARGLVQIADNVQKRPTYICNCCGCCCGQLMGINQYGLLAVNPSGFVPTVDLERCKGCSRCARACPVTALSMTARRVDAHRKNELHPKVDADRCIGCGVCADQCKPKAMQMTRSGRDHHVPEDVIERLLRRAIERNNLADFFFDAGAGRGSRFMNGVLRALLNLPPAQRALASEQVRSRFVRQALARMKDPTA